jgi:4-hydroxy-3-methylbut-2-enyl diphosphate reductase
MQGDEVTEKYFRKGFGLRKEVAETLAVDYHSQIVDRVRENNFALEVGNLYFRLAREFGFCFGVERAVEYAYEASRKFADKRLFLVGEIIHNPHVNHTLRQMGVTILVPGSGGRFDYSGITENDVVIIPAFGVTTQDLRRLQESGCVLVDTTCGSVLNVWKRVELYARDGFTALVHGKHFHEETQATVSQIEKYEAGKYVVVRDMGETELICSFIEHGGDPSDLQATFAAKVSEGLDFSHDLECVGIANQTTMLASESLAIEHRVRQALSNRYGEEHVDQHFRSFGTICTATQERQNAVLDLVEESPDMMVVIGGYNSSNTNHLAKLCSTRCPTFHIADASCIDAENNRICYKSVGSTEDTVVDGWLEEGAKLIGITAGASTPNNKIGETIERIVRIRGLSLPD